MTTTVVILVVALLTIAVLGFFTVGLTKELDRSSNVNLVNAWMLKQYQLSKYKENAPSLLFDGTPGKPPVPQLSDPAEITSVDQIKNPALKNSAYKIIADAYYDCWSAFGNGKYNFMGKQKIFCYPCTGIIFSQNVKDSGVQIQNLDSYMATTKPQQGSSKSYHELMGVSLEQLQDTPIETNNDLFIYFIGSKGLTWFDLGEYGAWGTGEASSKNTALKILGIVPTVPGLAIRGYNFAQGVYSKKQGKEEFYGRVVLGNAEDITKFCNSGTIDELSTALNAVNDKKPKPANFAAARSVFMALKEKIVQCASDSTITSPTFCDSVKTNLPEGYILLFNSKFFELFYNKEPYLEEDVSEYKFAILNPADLNSFTPSSSFGVWIGVKNEEPVNEIQFYKCPDNQICIKVIRLNSLEQLAQKTQISETREVAKQLVGSSQ